MDEHAYEWCVVVFFNFLNLCSAVLQVLLGRMWVPDILRPKRNPSPGSLCATFSWHPLPFFSVFRNVLLVAPLNIKNTTFQNRGKEAEKKRNTCQGFQCQKELKKRKKKSFLTFSGLNLRFPSMTEPHCTDYRSRNSDMVLLDCSERQL